MSARLGNVFYLVMPKDQIGALTEESSTDEVRDSSPSEEPEAISLSSQQEEEEQESPRRSHPEASSNETGLSQSRPSTQRRVIKNMDEIFQTMDELMKKLHRLRVNTTTRINTLLSCNQYPHWSHFSNTFFIFFLNWCFMRASFLTGDWSQPLQTCKDRKDEISCQAKFRWCHPHVWFCCQDAIHGQRDRRRWVAQRWSSAHTKTTRTCAQNVSHITVSVLKKFYLVSFFTNLIEDEQVLIGDSQRRNPPWSTCIISV